MASPHLKLSLPDYYPKRHAGHSKVLILQSPEYGFSVHAHSNSKSGRSLDLPLSFLGADSLYLSPDGLRSDFAGFLVSFSSISMR
jgi:hypothetical protein